MNALITPKTHGHDSDDADLLPSRRGVPHSKCMLSGTRSVASHSVRPVVAVRQEKGITPSILPDQVPDKP